MSFDERLRVRRPGIALFLILWAAVCASAGDSAPRARIGMTDIAGFGAYARQVKDALEARGVTVELVDMPSLRSLVSVNAGLADIDVVRIAEAAADYPNLVRIETPSLIVPVLAIRLRQWSGEPPPPLPDDGGWRKQRVGMPLGSYYLEKLTPTLAHPYKMMSSDFNLKALRRVDLYLAFPYLVDATRDMQDKIWIEPLPDVPPMVTYSFVNKNRPDLIALMQSVAAAIYPLQPCQPEAALCLKAMESYRSATPQN